MKKNVKKLLSWALALLMLIFLGLTAWQGWGYYQSQRTAARARQLAGLSPQPSPAAPSQPLSTAPETTPAPQPQTPPPAPQITTPPPEPLAEDALFLLALDLTALQAENPEVMGWICIPGTNISYPLLFTQDNEKYLSRAWDGTPSRAGSIFLECQNSPKLLDFNTIVYGHHMRNGSCFADLVKYRQEDFFRAHPDIYIVTDGDLRRYRVFSTYEAPVTSDTFRLNFLTTQRKQAALDHYIQSSLWQGDFVPTPEDRILTLSTCTGTGTYATRWVVQGVLSGIWLR